MNILSFFYGRCFLIRGVILSVSFALVFSGCSNYKNAKAIKEEVLKSDPGFSKTLQKRDEIANKISQMERELSLKQSQVDRQINQLRKEAAEARKQVNFKINQTKALLDPELQKIDLALSLAKDELKSKRSQRDNLGRSIQRLKKALKISSQAWSESQREQTQKDLDEFIQETSRLDAEISSLKAHIGLLKNKQRLLRI